MKSRNKIFLAVLPLALALSSCSPEPTMRVKPSELSEETQYVMKMLNDEILFWDCTLDESIQSCTADLWKCEDGQWQNMGGMSTKISHRETRIGLRMAEDEWDFYEWTENGYTRYSQELEGMDFSRMGTVSTSPLTVSAAIVPDEEMTLWYKLGAENGGIQGSADGDFRKAECDRGMAVTVTFSTHEIEP